MAGILEQLESVAALTNNGDIPTVDREGNIAALTGTIPGSGGSFAGEVKEDTLEKVVDNVTENIMAATATTLPYEKAVLPSDWKFSDWRQRHVMAIYKTDVLDLDKEFDSKFSQMYETIMVGAECGCFERPIGIGEETLLNMDWWEVEEIYDAFRKNLYNYVVLKKK